VLDVTLDAPGRRAAIAALRSMFVSEINNDLAASWLARKGRRKNWERTPLMDFKRASAVEVWAGRLVPSRHNPRPDMVLRDFKGASHP